MLNLDLPIEEWGREEGIDESHLRERVEQAADAMMAAKAANMGPELMRFIEKSLLIQTLDAVWKEHLYALDHMRQGIGLRAYGQRDPLNEYKSEAFALFNAMLDELKERVTAMLARVELAPEPVRPPPPMQYDGAASAADVGIRRRAGDGAGGGLGGARGAVDGDCGVAAMRSDAVDPNDPATWRNASRNAPCPCGSGKNTSTATDGWDESPLPRLRESTPSPPYHPGGIAEGLGNHGLADGCKRPQQEDGFGKRATKWATAVSVVITLGIVLKCTRRCRSQPRGWGAAKKVVESRTESAVANRIPAEDVPARRASR